MAHIHYRLSIRKSIEEVFAFVTDPTKNPEWQSGVVRVEVIGGALRVGARVIEVRRIFGREMAASWEVTSYDPPRARGFKIERPIPSQGLMTFERDGEATTVTFDMQMHGRGILRLVEPVLARVLGNATRADFQRVKVLLEKDIASSQ